MWPSGIPHPSATIKRSWAPAKTGAQHLRVLQMLAPVVLLSGCVSVPAAASPTGQASVSADVQPSASQSLPQGRLGHTRSVTWLLSPLGLSVSVDAGRSFVQVPLPSNVTSAQIAAVSAVPGATWLASRGPGRSIMVYARDSATGVWSPGAKLTPIWPADLGGAETQPPSSVQITPGGPEQVLVMTQLALTHSVAIPRLFVSSDGGLTFSQRVQAEVSDLNTPWSVIAMSGTQAVAVVGERGNGVIHSSDTGSTWVPSALRGIASGSDFVVGAPVFSGTTIYLPVAESDNGDQGAFVLLRSTDGGAVFDSLGAQTLALGAPMGAPPPITSVGATWWLVSTMTGSVYRSTDNGMSWSNSGTALPQGATYIAATDDQNATVWIEHNVCASGKTDCSSDQYAEITSDGGRTWTRI